MKRHIIHDSQPIALAGGGSHAVSQVKQVLAHFRKLVAADGGANYLVQAGMIPDAVVGDFDSVDADTLRSVPADRLVRTPDQDTTDFEKALEAISAPLVLACGFTGARTDHALAVMSGLLRFPERRCIVLGEQDISFLCPPELLLDLPVGMRLSVYPLCPLEGSSEGLRWPIDGLILAPGGRLGTSNEVTGPVRLKFDTPGALIILPLGALDDVIPTLLSAPGAWPARGKQRKDRRPW